MKRSDPMNRIILGFLLLVGLLAGSDLVFRDQLLYVRDAVDAGQWYRLFTCHFTHFTPYHLIMNLAGAAMAYAILFPRRIGRFITVMLMLGVLLGVGLHLWAIGLMVYGGFSGVLHGLVVFGIVQQLGLDRRDPFWWLALVCVAGKLIYEQSAAFDPGAMTAWLTVPVATVAHWQGSLAGLALGLVFFAWDHQRGLEQRQPSR